LGNEIIINEVLILFL